MKWLTKATELSESITPLNNDDMELEVSKSTVDR